LLGRLHRLIEQSLPAPVLDGALDHWLHSNLNLPPAGPSDILLPVLDGLAVGESGAERYVLRSFLAQLLRRGIVAPDRLFAIVLREGTPELASESVELFLEAWRDLPPAALRACLDEVGPPHEDEVITRLADVFARQFADAPADVLTFLADALDSMASLRALPVLVLATASRRRRSQLKFLLEFVSRAFPVAWGDPTRTEPLLQFLLVKYRLVIDALRRSGEDDRRSRGVLGPAMRTIVNPLLDILGARLWQRFVTDMPYGGNDRILEEDRGIVQRDLVRDFAPFVVAIHNGAAGRLSLEPGGSFHAIVVRMLNHRVTSVVGYLAAATVPIVLRGRWDALERLLDELVREPTDSGRFYAHLLLAHVAYLDPAEAPRALEVLGRRILPWFAADRFDWEWPTLFAFCITAVDIPALWPACRGILQQIFLDLGGRGDSAAVSALGDHLLKASFLADGGLGRRVLELLLEQGRLDDPVWQEAVLKVAAGLRARSPALLQRTLEDLGADRAVGREARRHVRKSVIAQRDLYASQVAWDRTIMAALASSPRFRYVLLRDLVGGIAQARSPADFGIAVRRCLVDVTVVLFGDEPDERYARLSIETVLGETAPGPAPSP
jgi:hypothetical protein